VSDYEWMDKYDDEAPPLENIGRAIFALARAVHDLGTAGATTNMGAIELLAFEVRNGFASLKPREPGE